jgi:hypothetical protein
MQSRYEVALAANPFDIVWGSAIQGGVEERLSEAAHINHYGQGAIFRRGSEERTQVPGGLRVEAVKL